MAKHPEDPAADEKVAPLDPRTARLLAGAAAPRELPAALRARLLALPADAERQDEGARRYERARALGLAAAPGGGELETPSLSRAERAIAAWIAAARRPAGLPVGLRTRLLAIGRAARRPLPFWLADARFAAAACLILTLLSMVAVEDASALLGERVAEASLTRRQWQERVVAGAASGRAEAAAAVQSGWRRGEEAFLSRAEAVWDLYEEKLRQFRQTELGRRLAGEPSIRGNNHGPQ